MTPSKKVVKQTMIQTDVNAFGKEDRQVEEAGQNPQTAEAVHLMELVEIIELNKAADLKLEEQQRKALAKQGAEDNLKSEQGFDLNDDSSVANKVKS